MYADSRVTGKDSSDPALQKLCSELLAIKDDEAEITERFYMEIEFGTAGLRGICGAGTNRMNELTVGRATQGIADYILQSGEDPLKGVVMRGKEGQDDGLVPLLLLAAGAVVFDLVNDIHSVFRYSSTSKGRVFSSFLRYSGWCGWPLTERFPAQSHSAPKRLPTSTISRTQPGR